MGRLVKPQVVDKAGKLSADKENKKKEYFERVAKYVPSEIIAGYLAISGAINGLPENAQVIAWVANFVFCLVLTPFYLSYMAEPNQPKRKHIIIAITAYFFWAYAVGGNGGLFGEQALNIYNSSMSSILLIAFSMVSGVFVPKASES